VPAELTCSGDQLYFVATDDRTGVELWRSDGTDAGTVLVSDINAGIASSSPARLTDVNGVLFFRADDGNSGVELWKSDGTPSGTVLVKDVNAGKASSQPNVLTNVDGLLYFAASDGRSGIELWRSDGTATRTTLVADLHPGPSSASPKNFKRVGARLFFSATDESGAGLWTVEGAGRPRLVMRFAGPKDTASPDWLTDINGTLFFAADDGTTGIELWRSDGTPEGTKLVKDIYPGPPSR